MMVDVIFREEIGRAILALAATGARIRLEREVFYLDGRRARETLTIEPVTPGEPSRAMQPDAGDLLGAANERQAEVARRPAAPPCLPARRCLMSNIG